MADNLLLSSLETAFAAVITAALTAANVPSTVYTGKNSADKVAPAVLCSADGDAGEEDPPRSGNYWVEVEIAVKSTAVQDQGAADATAADLNLVQAVWNSIRVSNLDQLLNATGQNITVFPEGYFFKSPKSGWDEHDMWVDLQTIRIYACGTILAA